jgi:hypothetical protein
MSIAAGSAEHLHETEAQKQVGHFDRSAQDGNWTADWTPAEAETD